MRYKSFGVMVALLCCLGLAMCPVPSFAQQEGADQGGAAPGIAEQIKAELAKLTGVALEDLKAETDLVADLGVDYGKLYYALTVLYETFKVPEPKSELTSVGKIVEYVEKTQGNVRGFGTRSAENPEAAFYVQKVYFATDRKATGESEIDDYFGGERNKNGALQYGLAEVNIPYSHKRGQLETPWMELRMFRDRRKHIFILSMDHLDKDAFFKQMQSKGDNGDDLLVYIHGFNVIFQDAVTRAAQIAVDFGFQGIPLAYSWPSNGNFQSYNADWEDVLWSVKHVEGLLLELHEKFKGRKIHIVAHSMGSQALLHAMRLLALSGKGKDGPMFTSVILCAPDFDSGLFAEQIAHEVHGLAKQWVVYASNNDFALTTSEQVNSAPRLGKPVTYAEGFQIIDASKLQVTPWSVPETHSYYATKKKVLDDMIGVLKGILPSKRGLKQKHVGAAVVWGLE